MKLGQAFRGPNGGIFISLVIDDCDRTQFLHVTSSSITPPYEPELIKQQLSPIDSPYPIQLQEAKMVYFGNFSLLGNFSQVMVYLYQERTGRIRFVSSDSNWCKEFDSWDMARAEIPNYAIVNLHQDKLIA